MAQLDIGAPTVLNASGTINPSGRAKQIVMILSSDFAGTMNGASISALAGGTLSFSTDSGDTYAPVVITRSAGSITYFSIT